MDLRLLRYFVVVADERHVGRAATRLHMTQPPLSRAIRRLEDEFGVPLLERTPHGVALTPAGTVLYAEARTLLDQADRLDARVRAAAGATGLVVGTLADTAEFVSTHLVGAFREQHPGVRVTLHETDLSDPTAGLRAGLVDVALTRSPFDTKGIGTHVLRTDPVGVVLRADDPLARNDSVSMAELADRRWVRLPPGTDPAWVAYWTGGPAATDLPERKTIQECLQAALWNGTCALAPLDQPVPDGLVVVATTDRAPSELLVAWAKPGPSPLVRSFAQVAAATIRGQSRPPGHQR